MKLKKRKKYSRMHGKGMGTAGTGARKNKRKSGNHGGAGMAGSGKRADHKKTLVQKLYGQNYFGKRGVTSRKTKKDKKQRINLQDIQSNLEKYGKKKKDFWEIDLKEYKVLGRGDVKDKLIITCLEASSSAIEKVRASGGEVRIIRSSGVAATEVENSKHLEEK